MNQPEQLCALIFQITIIVPDYKVIKLAFKYYITCQNPFNISNYHCTERNRNKYNTT